MAHADMLKAIYPQIKAANPAAHVIIGGLLLDCDPNNPSAGRDCKPSRFLEGVLREGGGPYFGAVGTHSYDTYAGALGSYSISNWHTASNNVLGPSTDLEAKTGYVRGLLTAYGVSGKFLVNSESAVGLFAVSSNATYETTEAYYVAQVFGTALAQHILANVWFSLNDDWHHEALLDSNNNPRPAYVAYQFASQWLTDVTYVHAITTWAGIKGFVFDRQGHPLWLLWAQDGGVHALTLSGVPAAIYHVDGTTLAVTGNQLSVGPESLYVAWP